MCQRASPLGTKFLDVVNATWENGFGFFQTLDFGVTAFGLCTKFNFKGATTWRNAMAHFAKQEFGVLVGTEQALGASKRYAIHTNEPVRRTTTNPCLCRASTSTHREWVLRARPVPAALPCRHSATHIHWPYSENAGPNPDSSWCHSSWRRAHPSKRSALPGAINSCGRPSSCHCPGTANTKEGDIPATSGRTRGV